MNLIRFLNTYKTCSDKINQAGGVAAPVGGSVLKEVLAYLELNKDNEEQEVAEELTMPEIRNLSIAEAEKHLKDLGIELEINYLDDGQIIDKKEVLVKEQTPKPGIKIKSGTKVYVEI